MSVPFGLTISYDAAKKTFVDVELNRAAVMDLYGYLKPRFEKTWPFSEDENKDYAGCFVGMFPGGVMPFYHLPAKEYRQACEWTFEAVEKLETLQPYKKVLEDALRSDSRYNEALKNA